MYNNVVSGGVDSLSLSLSLSHLKKELWGVFLDRSCRRSSFFIIGWKFSFDSELGEHITS